MVSVSLLCVVLLGLPVLFGVHAVSCRWAHARGGPRSPQGFLLKIVGALNLTLLPLVVFVGTREARGAGEIALMALYAFAVFNGIAYAYFHLFNATETARRTRMLVEIRRRGSIGEEELRDLYGPEHMVVVRLDRMVRFGQIVKGSDGRYRVTGRFLLAVAYAIQTWRRFAGYREPGETLQ